MYRIIFLFSCLVAALGLRAQTIVSGGYTHHFLAMPKLNAIADTFNLRENHQLPHVKSLSGFQFTLGTVQELALVEIGFSNSMRRLRSFTPNQLRETAELSVNYMAANINIGFRPFPQQYFFVGLGANFGVKRLRYSFGGDYITPVKSFALAPELFIDYSVKIKFLLKQNLRNQTFYLFRIRPFYQLHFPTNVAKLEQSLNNNTGLANSDPRYDEMWSNFGVHLALVVPISKIPTADPQYSRKQPKQPKMTEKERRERFKLKQ